MNRGVSQALTRKLREPRQRKAAMLKAREVLLVMHDDPEAEISKLETLAAELDIDIWLEEQLELLAARVTDIAEVLALLEREVERRRALARPH